jgi:hypothetical protein
MGFRFLALAKRIEVTEGNCAGHDTLGGGNMKHAIMAGIACLVLIIEPAFAQVAQRMLVCKHARSKRFQSNK